MNKTVKIGIDLGQTHCSVGAIFDESFEYIADEKKRTSFPCCVTFGPDGYRVGETALSLGLDRSKQIQLSDISPLFGHQLDDPKAQECLAKLPCQTERNEKGVLIFDVPSKPTAQEITVKIISWLKELTEKQVKKPVREAVIAVPCDFDGAQRKSIYKAGLIAGIQQIKVVDSVVAATTTFTRYNPSVKGNLLGFDLGASQLSMSVVATDGPAIEVKHTKKVYNFGGDSFTQRMLQFCKNTIK